MNSKVFKGLKRILLFVSLAMILMCITSVSAMAAEHVNVKEGLYTIKAINGHPNGQFLYFSEYSDEDKKLQFEKSNTSPDVEWLIKKDPIHEGGYNIISYYGGNNQEYQITMNEPNGDSPVYCSKEKKYESAFEFYRESGSDDYNNLTIRPACDTNYKLNRHKKVKLGHDLIYVNANKDNDNNNKLWQLVPIMTSVTYMKDIWLDSPVFKTETHQLLTEWTVTTDELKSSIGVCTGWIDYNTGKLYKPGQTVNVEIWRMLPKWNGSYTTVNLKAAAPSITAKKKGKIAVDWGKCRNRMKSKKFWKKTKYVIIQYSTDKQFKKEVNTLKVKKKSVNRENAKKIISKLEKNKTYHIRVRLWDGANKYSKWCKSLKIKTKK